MSTSLIDADKYCWDELSSWGENYAGSSGLQSPKVSIDFMIRERSATVCTVFVFSNLVINDFVLYFTPFTPFIGMSAVHTVFFPSLTC